MIRALAMGLKFFPHVTARVLKLRRFTEVVKTRGLAARLSSTSWRTRAIIFSAGSLGALLTGGILGGALGGFQVSFPFAGASSHEGRVPAPRAGRVRAPGRGDELRSQDVALMYPAGTSIAGSFGSSAPGSKIPGSARGATGPELATTPASGTAHGEPDSATGAPPRSTDPTPGSSNGAGPGTSSGADGPSGGSTTPVSGPVSGTHEGSTSSPLPGHIDLGNGTVQVAASGSGVSVSAGKGAAGIGAGSSGISASLGSGAVGVSAGSSGGGSSATSSSGKSGSPTASSSGKSSPGVSVSVAGIDVGISSGGVTSNLNLGGL